VFQSKFDANVCENSREVICEVSPGSAPITCSVCGELRTFSAYENEFCHWNPAILSGVSKRTVLLRLDWRSTVLSTPPPRRGR
jgi:hypothetical protein